MTNSLARRMTAGAASVTLLIGGLALASSPASAAPSAGSAALTNTAHLDFLLDEVSPPEVPGHSSYRLDTEPAITLPWTYADARDGGTFERVGGGPLDAATGDYGQGAFNSDDVARAAVVYLRHWQQTGDDASRQKAYEVLRALAYFQTTEGPDAGNVVLWMQPDGSLNPSAEPVELPDPSDSAESYWLARSLWALGEGFAAFRDVDPSFAAFLQERVQLGVAAVDREVLDSYGQYAVADGVSVPAWLIVDGADATAEAVLGLSAYTAAAPSDVAARDALAKLAEGIAALGSATTDPAGPGAGAALADPADAAATDAAAKDAAADGAGAGSADADADADAGASAADAGSGGSSHDTGAADALAAAGTRNGAQSGAGSWPYGAILPWAESRSMWHAWSSQMAGALARASVALDDDSLLQPAITESARFAPTLLTAGGPDNARYPSPTERVQLAYGADSRLQNLLATAEAADLPGLADLAGLQAAWFFGLNPAATLMYDPATGVTYDGIQPDGSINRNSGAESTIHGLLSMLALDAHPSVSAMAQSLTTLDARDGLRVIEAEDATSTTGTVVTPESTWTEESSWSGSYLALQKGQKATFSLGTAENGMLRVVEPVVWQVEKGTAATPKSLWRTGWLPLGALSSSVGEQGITAASGALLPQRLTVPVPASRDSVEVRALAGEVDVDALLVRPAVGTFSGSGSGSASGAGAVASAQLAQNNLGVPQRVTLGASGLQTLRSYDGGGALVSERTITAPTTVWLPPGGYALALTQP
ncbi:hypothetical protein [Herbiconiux ginsengi]|uniref:Uncharacterized protein n=1 Tax=Herbiconiux ginsengi TaxID=381665 RepID=A0A1H3MK15_9MICO|nr:hypothetical protein [Herbiconiux ginsengi]SDY76435.1 hypothetical protein SAMN05216554_1438 [Herbiconiux ginsengi]